MGRGVRLVNTYGPTEATIVGVMSELTDEAAERHAKVPLGRPIANVQAYVLDEHGQPVPVGVAGELHLGGAGLARGYLHHSDLTAQRFVPHPFASEPGARLYKTGDLARYRPDGTIKFVGRVDQQVKLRGYRVELGEVEAAIVEHPAVREAVVMAYEDTPSRMYLAAYVVAQGPRPFTMNELRAFLQPRLPEYMIPAALVLLEGLPLTTSGKVDRRALLPRPRTGGPGRDRGRTADRVGIHDNFFELGGHSMLAIQLMARVQEAFQLELSLRLFFERPTIAELAVAIDEQLLKEIEGLSEEEAVRLLQNDQ